ncbi:MAG TPA: sulfite exporter TauE/SafE family protein [Vicinamibacterales bacterium]|nr:sulfite exporter TauE/SafE family protein [Vicinamibacterales bacterium]
MTAFLTGLVLGVVSSAHCLGMCGPLVLAIGPRLERIPRAAQVQRLLLYHAGRVVIYTLLAIPAGVAGQMLWVQGFGRPVAIVAAVLLTAAALGTGRVGVFGRLGRLSSSVAGRACAAAARWSRSRPVSGTFAAGAANGLLPCGMVYAAIVVAAGFGTIPDALATMAGFGVGTMPALIVLSMSAASLPLNLRARIERLTPVVLMLAAALLLVRAFDMPAAAPHVHAAASHH